MTKLHKLAQLNKDIELLESYGDFKAADVLHKKFIREAQIKPTSYATEDRGYTYEKYFNDKLKKLQNAQNKDLVISEIRSDGFLKEEDKIQIINAISNSEKSAPVGQPSEQVRQEQKSHQEYLDSIKTPLIPVPEKKQQQSPVQTLSDTANQNAFNSFINSPTNANNPSQYIYQDLMGNAKHYLSISDFNNAAIIREQAANSNMTQQEKNAWQQEYANLIQNYSGMAKTKQYEIEEQAEQNIYNAAEQLGIEIINPQSIAQNEDEIKNQLIKMRIRDRETYRLLRQVSLSGYYSAQ